jgi:hypothetical protein
MKEFYPNDCEMDHHDGPAAGNACAILSPTFRRIWIEDGILRVPAAYSQTRLATLRSSLTDLATCGASATRAGTRGLLGRSGAVRALAISEPALTLARGLIGGAARPVKAALFDKVADANWTLPWHQDLTVALRPVAEAPGSSSWPGFTRWSVKSGITHAEAPRDLLDRMVALRLHLDDCDARNGPLLVVPGSHRRGKLDAAARRDLPAEVGVRLREAKAGDVLAMHPLLLHRSGPAENPSHRRVIHLEYAAAPLPEGLAWRYDPMAETGRKAQSKARPRV